MEVSYVSQVDLLSISASVPNISKLKPIWWVMIVSVESHRSILFNPNIIIASGSSHITISDTVSLLPRSALPKVFPNLESRLRWSVYGLDIVYGLESVSRPQAIEQLKGIIVCHNEK
jgi:hypothetical protein